MKFLNLNKRWVLIISRVLGDVVMFKMISSLTY